jgi:hypothetical protein
MRAEWLLVYTFVLRELGAELRTADRDDSISVLNVAFVADKVVEFVADDRAADAQAEL